MLSTLRIRNLAVVADLLLELPPGLVVITGETGAGKSIIIGALNLLLGQRADRALIRSGADNCTVEAVFEIGTLGPSFPLWLEANGLEPCEDQHLVLKRTFTTAGANRQFINGTPTSLNVLTEVGEWLVDMHGPHDHQSLLEPAKQLAILDAYGNLEADREQFAALVRRRAALEAEKAALVLDERAYAQQLDLLRFQVHEIAQAQLRADEEVEVQQDYQRASNAARLLQLSQTALGLLTEDETSVLTQAGALGRQLQELRRIDPQTEALLPHHERAIEALRELQSGLSRYVDRLELDPARLQALEDRLNLIQTLKRKYGANLAEVLAFAEAALQKLRQLEQRDVELARLNAELRQVNDAFRQTGQRLTGLRRQVIPRLVQSVSGQLAHLGFKQSLFDVTLTTREFAADSTVRPGLTGLDTVEFQFAPNPGEPPRPLRAIASSGEIARVMLALKTVLAAEDQVPVLVFDEVDANVGGETAHAVGEKMRQIARQRQVLCITHLAPVAAAASAHALVSKEVVQGRTVATLKLLNQTERVTELARMLGGQTEAARRHAASLLKSSSSPLPGKSRADLDSP